MMSIVSRRADVSWRKCDGYEQVNGRILNSSALLGIDGIPVYVLIPVHS